MQHCKTCKYWQYSGNSYHHEDRLLRPVAPATQAPIALGFEVRLCRHPLLTHDEPPTDRRGLALGETGGEYLPCLATAEDFGCVLHEQA